MRKLLDSESEYDQGGHGGMRGVLSWRKQGEEMRSSQDMSYLYLAGKSCTARAVHHPGSVEGLCQLLVVGKLACVSTFHVQVSLVNGKYSKS